MIVQNAQTYAKLLDLKQKGKCKNCVRSLGVINNTDRSNGIKCIRKNSGWLLKECVDLNVCDEEQFRSGTSETEEIESLGHVTLRSTHSKCAPAGEAIINRESTVPFLTCPNDQFIVTGTEHIFPKRIGKRIAEGFYKHCCAPGEIFAVLGTCQELKECPIDQFKLLNDSRHTKLNYGKFFVTDKEGKCCDSGIFKFDNASKARICLEECETLQKKVIGTRIVSITSKYTDTCCKDNEAILQFNTCVKLLECVEDQILIEKGRHKNIGKVIVEYLFKQCCLSYFSIDSKGK